MLTPPEPYTTVKLIADLSVITIQKQKVTLPNHCYTKALWGALQMEFPTKLLVSWQNKVIPINTEEAGVRMCREWDLTPINPFYKSPHTPNDGT